ncbi:hypothetical protein CHU92_13535 [Flavobacterium cyanobacteriorum]|uniref:Uncharacterized protein n=1 Tax=Flavobacterium cyanobacteriorum TaxID=2022802 RepID=A0A255YV78_9FLAO|nr:hypothetical protein [Flavobacterium cyanobacteriorum]OYQ33156.1 hypothetical protein CHU92_13535 [Flavobacterium cyanobacteriorum]
MFLKFIKDFGLKKNIKKTLSQYKPVSSPDIIITVGILIDKSYFTDKEALINDLAQNGIKAQNIQTLSFKERIKKKEIISYNHYTRKEISGEGKFIKEDVAAFINTPFDMLISYYDVEKPPLVWATLKSKAKFKVGFATVDKRLNHFMISTVAEKHAEFITELFKYLKILNKI